MGLVFGKLGGFAFGEFAFGFGGGGSGPTPPDPAPFSYVDTRGYSVTGPDTTPGASPYWIEKPFTAIRSGFGPNGSVVDYHQLMTETAFMRQDYPNQGQADAAKAFLSDYLYANDLLTGAANNSEVISPKPVMRITSLYQTVVGNTLDSLAAMAAHRNGEQGQQIACARFTLSGEGPDVDIWVNTTTLSSKPGWAIQIDEFEATDVDLSGFADKSYIKWRVRGYPWRGSTESIFDSDEVTTHWTCPSVYFYKHVAKAENPPVGVVNPLTGSASGVISTNPATARATPFATYAQFRAAVAGATYAALTDQEVDGAICYIDGLLPSATNTFNSAASATRGFAHTIARYPGTSMGANAIASLAGVINVSIPSFTALPAAMVHFEGLKYTVIAGNGLQGATAGAVLTDLRFINCEGDHNVGSFGLYGARIRNVSIWGGTYLDRGGFNARSAGQTAFFGPIAERWHADPLNPSDGGIDVGCLIGGRFIGFNSAKMVAARYGTSRVNGYFCEFYRALGGQLFSAHGTTDRDTVIGNVLIEVNGGGTGVRAQRISGDNDTTNVVNLIRFNITTAQPGSTSGGDNSLYDETADTPRTHHLGCLVNCIMGATPFKGGWFIDVAGRTGNLWVGGAVGDRGIFRAGQTGFMKQYQGVDSWPNPATEYLDPGFVDNKCPVYPDLAPTMGGGDYRLAAGSPCIGAGGGAVIRHTLDGQVRPLTADHIGAYGPA